MEELWQEDWNVFAGLLQEYLNLGKRQKELTDCFAGKSIKWRGQLDEKNIDDDISPSVGISLPRKEIYLDSSHARIGSLRLPIAEEAKESWRGVQLESTVNFTAKLRGKDAPMPTIYLNVLDPETLVILVGLSEGRVFA